MIGEVETDKRIGDLVVTLVVNREGILCAFGLRGVKKATETDLGKGIAWMDICTKSDTISNGGKVIFSDIKKILQVELAHRAAKN